jgi:hypothetical protein
VGNVDELRGWLKRLVSSDRRRKDRIESPGLVAHYWTGAAPRAKGVLNINSIGSYLLTEERWYPGTVIKVTLQVVERRNHLFEEKKDRRKDVIAVLAQVVRSGQDGVGLEFIYPEADDPNSKHSRSNVCSDHRQLDAFLERAEAAKSELAFTIE